MKLQGKIVFNLFLVVFFAGVIYMSVGYPADARMVPLVIAIPGLIIAAIQLAGSVRGQYADVKTTSEPRSSQAEEVAEETGLAPEEIRKREIAMAAWIVFVLGLILVFGFWIAIAATLLLFTRFYGKESWKISIWSAVGGWTLIFIIFNIVLEVPLFEGFLFRLIG